MNMDIGNFFNLIEELSNKPKRVYNVNNTIFDLNGNDEDFLAFEEELRRRNIAKNIRFNSQTSQHEIELNRGQTIDNFEDIANDYGFFRNITYSDGFKGFEVHQPVRIIGEDGKELKKDDPMYQTLLGAVKKQRSTASMASKEGIDIFSKKGNWNERFAYIQKNPSDAVNSALALKLQKNITCEPLFAIDRRTGESFCQDGLQQHFNRFLNISKKLNPTMEFPKPQPVKPMTKEKKRDFVEILKTFFEEFSLFK